MIEPPSELEPVEVMSPTVLGYSYNPSKYPYWDQPGFWLAFLNKKIDPEKEVTGIIVTLESGSSYD